MDGIEIKVTGATPLEVLARIGAFGMHCLANSDVCAAAQRIYEAEAHKSIENNARPNNQRDDLKRLITLVAGQLTHGLSRHASDRSFLNAEARP